MIERRGKTRSRAAAGFAAAQRPLYRRVTQVLKQEIVTGVYAVGAQLPTEADLCGRFRVSRHTVREALRQLRTDGLVVSRRGSGTTVARSGAPARYVHTVNSIEELVSYANETRYEVEHSTLVVTDAVLAERLGCRAGESWLRIDGLRFTPGEPAPICWTEVFVRSEFSGITRVLSRRPGPIYAWIEDLYGERIAEIEQVLSARPIPAAVAGRLQVAPHSAGMEIRRTYRLTSGENAEIAFNLHPADRFTYSMTLRRSTP